MKTFSITFLSILYVKFYMNTLFRSYFRKVALRNWLFPSFLGCQKLQNQIWGLITTPMVIASGRSICIILPFYFLLVFIILLIPNWLESFEERYRKWINHLFFFLVLVFFLNFFFFPMAILIALLAAGLILYQFWYLVIALSLFLISSFFLYLKICQETGMAKPWLYWYYRMECYKHWSKQKLCWTKLPGK